MTLTDLELETRLRDQRTRAAEIAPAPVDLAQRVRQQAREQHRRRVALTAVGVAAALVFVGLPVLASGWLPLGSRSESAAPVSRTPSQHDVRPLFDLPTRGSLAGDEGWLAGIVRETWRPPSLEEGIIMGVPVHDPPVDSRYVAFAGDVPGGRVALVLGLDGRPVHAWFVGPEGADPDEMTLATYPVESAQREPLALWAAPDPASEDQVLVVVGQPGDEVDVLTGRDVTAAGETEDVWQSVPMEDGAGAVEPARPFTWPPGMDFRVRRDGEQQPLFPALEFSEELAGGSPAPVDVADPRGLLGAADAEEVQWTLDSLIAHYGLPAEQLSPTLLVAGPVSSGSTTSVVLLGVTFPSGATTTSLAVYWGPDDGGMTVTAVSADPAPAGIALLDRLIAFATSNVVTVSAPTGVTAEVYRDDGTLLTTVPLVDGAGSAPLAPSARPHERNVLTVRVLDGSGAAVAETTVERQG